MANFRVQVLGNTATEPAAVANVPVGDAITGANMDIILAQIAALSIGTVGPATLNTSVLHDAGSLVRPASQLAQRENRYRINYTDDVTNKKYSFSIGAADLTIVPTGSEFVDLGAGAGAAFVAAVEPLLESELGNACTITSIQFVVV